MVGHERRVRHGDQRLAGRQRLKHAAGARVADHQVGGADALRERRRKLEPGHTQAARGHARAARRVRRQQPLRPVGARAHLPREQARVDLAGVEEIVSGSDATSQASTQSCRRAACGAACSAGSPGAGDASCYFPDKHEHVCRVGQGMEKV